MLSIPDMAMLGAAALLLFGPEQLPRVARKAGHVMREIQNTSQSFIRELERAADVQDAAAKPYEPPEYDPAPYEVAPHHDDPPYDGATHGDGTVNGDEPYGDRPYVDQPYEVRPYDDAPTVAMRAVEPPAPAPERPPSAGANVGEKLAEPRPALDLIEPAAAEPAAPVASEPAEPAPQGDHPAHL